MQGAEENDGSKEITPGTPREVNPKLRSTSVAQEKSQSKSPQELGEAVGQKIEELFGGMFGEDTPADDDPSTHGGSQATAAVPRDAKPAPDKGPAPKSPAPSPPAPPTPKPPQPGPRKPSSLDQLLEQIEAAILNLEWEMSADTVKQLSKDFDELLRIFKASGPAKTVFEMNLRVLKLFSAPGASPHPQLVKLLQDSYTFAKQLYAGKGKVRPDKDLMVTIASSYKQIIGSPPAPAPAEPPQPEKKTKEAPSFPQVAKNLSATVSSLEEVSQRLSRILAVLRQGSEMPGEEVNRRLGTLEGLLTERVSQLNAIQKNLSLIDPATIGGDSSGGHAEPADAFSADGVFMISWYNVPVAIPSAILEAVYPLSSAQADQLAGKEVVTLGGRQLGHLPVNKPKGTEQRKPPKPTWLLHLAHGGKEYFLLADKTIGYRSAPKGLDMEKQTRMKLGNTAYMLINPSVFR